MNIKFSKNQLVHTPNVKTLKPLEKNWSEFLKEFESPNISNLNFSQYIQYLQDFYYLEDKKETLTENDKIHKKEIKGYIDNVKFNGGFWFGGTFKDDNRTSGVTSKSFITLDIDDIPQDIDFIARLKENKYLSQFEYIVHSTAKHIPQVHQRYRLIIPLLVPITDEISLKYEAISRYIANTIMDINLFDKSAFLDNHLMLYPVIANQTPQGYYFFYHNATNNFLNPQEILNTYENYQDRYSFAGVERPSHPQIVEKSYTYDNTSLITPHDKDILRSFLAEELLSNGIENPMDLTNQRKKFGCICGSSDGANFYGNNMVCCFSSNHDSRLGKISSKGDCYCYDIFDLYAYSHNLDAQKDFIKIANELSNKYHHTLDNQEKVTEFLSPTTKSRNNTKNIDLPSYITQSTGKDNNISYSLNTQNLADYIREHEKYILVVPDDNRGEPEFYWYIDGVYNYFNNITVRSYIKEKYITPYKKLSSRIYSDSAINKVCTDLKTDFFKRVPISKLNNNENIINFKNGLLYIDTMQLKEHSYKEYSTIQLPCNYNPSNTSAPIFSKYLNDLTEGNRDVARVLLEFMAVAISNVKGFRTKKALFTIGKGDSGKSQIRLLVNKLIGEKNTSSIDLDMLEERFGTSAIYQKRIVGSADMGFLTVKQLRTFKMLTGGDLLFAEFKGDNAFNFRFDGVVWFSANEMPRFGGDKGDWVYERMIIIKCNNVIPPEKQDDKILDKMFNEREAIINILLPHLRNVLNNKCKYHIPQECIATREEYKKENSLVKTFLDECTEPRNGQDNCTTKKTYDVFKAWCNDNSRGYTPTNQEFRKELTNIFNVSDIKELERKSPRGNRYYPFTITSSTKRDYVQIYGYDSVK